MMRTPRSILILRPDRLGDVIVSTPVQRLVRERYPEARITWLVQDWIAPLLEGLPGMTGVIRYQPRSRHAGWAGWKTLVQEIQAVGADAVVALQSTPRVSSAALSAGVPWRVGPLSKLHSFFLYNHGLRQKRSESTKHEAEYGMELLARLPGWGDRAPDFALARVQGPEVAVSFDALSWAREWCASRGISPGQAVGIHPGMGGSALNWPFEQYIALARTLLQDGRKIVVTAGAGEEDMAARLVAACSDLAGEARARLHVCGARSDGMNLPRLAALQSQFAGFMAPSTGPLHLASSVGTPVVSVYPPIQVQHPDRWGPYVTGARAQVLVPVTRDQCGAQFQCRGAECRFHPCMQRVTSDDVRKALAELTPGD